MTTISAFRSRAGAQLPSASALVLVVGYAALLLHGIDHWSYDVSGGLIVGPVLLAAGILFVRAAARYEADPRMPRILMWALWFKLAGSIARYVVGFGVYGGVADANGYSGHGAALAQNFRHLDFSHLPTNIPGTGFIDVLTGFVYTITGPTIVGGYFVFSFFGFCGAYFFYRGVVVGLPSADHTRLAKLLFFLPSMVFWPSSIGKDAWVFLGIGLTVWGMGRIVAGMRHGIYPLLVGLGITVSTRPNITAILFVAIFVGYLLRPGSKKASTLGPIYKFIGVAGLLVLGFVVIQQAKNFFGVDNLSATSVQGLINSTTERTSIGGSSFHASTSSSLLHLPQAALTVLFRPYPWQANNGQMLLAAAEGFFLLVFTIYSWPRLRSVGRRLREPLVAACAVYTLEFIYAFSAFGNFGILTRERVQVFPFFLVLLSLKPILAAKKPSLSYVQRISHPAVRH